MARNLDREKVGRSHLKISRTIAEQVMQTGEPLVTIESTADIYLVIADGRVLYNHLGEVRRPGGVIASGTARMADAK